MGHQDDSGKSGYFLSPFSFIPLKRRKGKENTLKSPDLDFPDWNKYIWNLHHQNLWMLPYYHLRDSADMIKDLEMGRISWFIQVGSKYPHKEVEEDLTTEEKAMGLQKREWCSDKHQEAKWVNRHSSTAVQEIKTSPAVRLPGERDGREEMLQKHRSCHAAQGLLVGALSYGEVNFGSGENSLRLVRTWDERASWDWCGFPCGAERLFSKPVWKDEHLPIWNRHLDLL